MQELTLGINLGAGLAGEVANIRAQLRGTNGATVGGLVSTGFTEVGTKGTYQWFYGAYPVGFEGSVEFSISGTIWSIVGINNADFGVTSVASIAAAVWAYTPRTLTSFGTLVADVATAVWAAATRTLTSFGSLVSDTAAAVWSYTPRTLTQGSAGGGGTTTASAISRRRGDTWTISLTIGDISTRTKLWFTIKNSDRDLDPASIIQIIEGTGLVYLNGEPGIAGQGSITVTNAVTGAITISVDEAATAQLALSQRLYFDVQWRGASDVLTPVDGVFSVTRDATRATS